MPGSPLDPSVGSYGRSLLVDMGLVVKYMVTKCHVELMSEVTIKWVVWYVR